MNSINEVFPLVKKYLQEEEVDGIKVMSENLYKLWIEPINDADVTMVNNTVTIKVDTNFTKSVIENNNFTEKLADGFQSILGFLVEVKIISKEEVNKDNFNQTPTPSKNVATAVTEVQPVQKQETLDTITSNKTTTANTNMNNHIAQPQPAVHELNSNESTINLNTNIDNKSDNNTIVSKEEVKSENYNYTFDTFIVGPSNQFAYVNCKSITDPQGVVKANPLFIYGPSGLGKTHLLRAIENAIRVQHPEKKIISVSSETFTNDIITAIGNQQTEEFRNKYRAADILLVDDVQFIAGKESTQVEFFNTFNTLYDAGKQIVLTSDRPPKDIKTLEDRLRTRFESGITADVNYPDFETRIAIINKKADELGLSLQPNVAAFIAENLKTHIRQLGGIVKKLQSYQLLTGQIPELSLAQTVIKEVLSTDQPREITVEKIIDEVAKSHSVTSDDIRSSKRNSNLSTPRQIAFYIIKEIIADMSLDDIGKEFSGRDHSTITYHIGQVKKKIQTDAKLNATIDDIIKNVQSK